MIQPADLARRTRAKNLQLFKNLWNNFCFVIIFGNFKTSVCQSDRTTSNPNAHASAGMTEQMEVKDFYNILGVSENATQEEIKRAYRELAKKYHPDASSETQRSRGKISKNISEAYDVLSNPEKRQKARPSHQSPLFFFIFFTAISPLLIIVHSSC
ncbi:MAG: J domain-containing protein, partial [candidate division KSB1 bacterium]|nr:J domain-containing protein [candidate division KSB1 bacterium]